MSTRDFTIVKRFDAPRELVFQAWTDPKHLDLWYAGSAAPERPTTVDLRVGGVWTFHMIENADTSYSTGGLYREIAPPERLVFTFGAVGGWPPLDLDDHDGNPVVTITLNEIGDGTEMVFHVGFADHLTEERIQRWLDTGMAGGWAMTLDRLDGLFPPPADYSYSVPPLRVR
jgi:uncharacterized protein YndB with AHSA1/START domain